MMVRRQACGRKGLGPSVAHGTAGPRLAFLAFRQGRTFGPTVYKTSCIRRLAKSAAQHVCRHIPTTSIVLHIIMQSIINRSVRAYLDPSTKQLETLKAEHEQRRQRFSKEKIAIAREADGLVANALVSATSRDLEAC